MFLACDEEQKQLGKANPAPIRVTGALSRPSAASYTQACPDDQWIEIRVRGLNPSIPGLAYIDWQVTDFFGDVVEYKGDNNQQITLKGTIEFNSANGASQSRQIKFNPRHHPTGIFTVRASVQGGLDWMTFETLGTRPTRFMNYAVFSDPAVRRLNYDIDRRITSADLLGWQTSGPVAGVDRCMSYGLDIIAGGGGRDPVFDQAFIPWKWMGLHVTRGGEMAWSRFWIGPEENQGGTNMDMLNLWARPDYQYLGYYSQTMDDAAGSLKQPAYVVLEISAYLPRGARIPAGRTGSYGGELIACTNCASTSNWDACPSLQLCGEAEFWKYIQGLAKIHIVHGPHRPIHYYQILWEPDCWWNGWMPNISPQSDIGRTRLQQIAYTGIHDIYEKRANGDLVLPTAGGASTYTPAAEASWRTRAVVLGPTSSGHSRRNNESIDWHTRNFNAGFYKYIDGFSTHPYNDPVVNYGASQDEDNFANVVVRHMDLVREYMSRRLPGGADFASNPLVHDRIFFWGTEQGLREARNVGEQQARRLMRQNLIMLGEGYDMNYLFCWPDYNDDERYGFFYNHSPMITNIERHAPDTTSPKAAAAALAAQSFLLTGYKHAAYDARENTPFTFPTPAAGNLSSRIQGLGAGNMGYKFVDTWCCNDATHLTPCKTKEGPYMYALWRISGSANITFTVDEAAGKISVYNIMAHDITDKITINGRALNLTISENVIYIKVEPGV